MVQLKMTVSELNNSKRLWNNNFVKMLKWADN